jgi:hypothetical protein
VHAPLRQLTTWRDPSRDPSGLVQSCPRFFIPLPPFATTEPTPQAGYKSYKDALCGAQIRDFNHALCQYYRRHCEYPPQCPPDDAEIARNFLVGKPKGIVCADLSQNCLSWARSGECQSNPGFMASECAQSCGKCVPPSEEWEARQGYRFPHPFMGDPTTTCFDEEVFGARLPTLGEHLPQRLSAHPPLALLCYPALAGRGELLEPRSSGCVQVAAGLHAGGVPSHMRVLQCE